MSKKNLVRRTILSIDLAIYSIYIIIGFMFINFKANFALFAII